MKHAAALNDLLKNIDRKGYPAYKSTRGSYRFDNYTLSIDHVQGDPFASPSKLSIEIPGTKAGFPKEYYRMPHTRTALCDHLTRLFKKALDDYNFKARGSGKSGLIAISHCGQEVLARTACTIDPACGSLFLHFEVGFPANGRTINSRELIKILFDFLPKCVSAALLYKNIDQKALEDVIFLAEDQAYIRKELKRQNLVAFVANGSILPRLSGVSKLPLKDAIPFSSPESYLITLTLPHRGTLSGMGIPAGITLIVGGGYHGKSTLLKALEVGVYDHIKGDGREYVITDPTAVKIRAEDGRSIKNTDISMFINHLPNGKDTTSFATDDASGSTSQAANVIEAMEAGTSLLLIDEDTSATNFMIRDELMQRVVNRDQEPITPFLERVKSLYMDKGISSIIVAGSSGSYFHVADHILQMNEYIPYDITSFAKKEAQHFSSLSIREPFTSYPDFRRTRRADGSLRKERRLKLKTLGKDAFLLNKETIDLRYVEQIVDTEQTTALSYCLLYAQLHLMDGKKSLQQIVKELLDVIEKKGLSHILDSDYVKSNLAMPRKEEIFACLNRYRK